MSADGVSAHVSSTSAVTGTTTTPTATTMTIPAAAAVSDVNGSGSGSVSMHVRESEDGVYNPEGLSLEDALLRLHQSKEYIDELEAQQRSYDATLNQLKHKLKQAQAVALHQQEREREREREGAELDGERIHDMSSTLLSPVVDYGSHLDKSPLHDKLLDASADSSVAVALPSSSSFRSSRPPSRASGSRPASRAGGRRRRRGEKKAAAAVEDDGMSPEAYYTTPMWKFLMKRLPWLVVLLLLQSFGALIMNRYEKLLEEHLVLNFFIPMLVGTSGNAGNQPGVMVTRAQSLGKLHVWKTFRKETPLAIIIGGVLGCVAYLRIYFVYPDEHGSALAIGLGLFVAVVVAVHLSIFFSMLLGAITCCDPADGAVPLLSTCSDVLGIVIVVGIASQLLPYPKSM